MQCFDIHAFPALMHVLCKTQAPFTKTYDNTDNKSKLSAKVEKQSFSILLTDFFLYKSLCDDFIICILFIYLFINMVLCFQIFSI